MDASAVHGMVFNVGEMGSGNTCNETDMVQCSGDVISFLVQQRLGRKAARRMEEECRRKEEDPVRVLWENKRPMAKRRRS